MRVQHVCWEYAPWRMDRVGCGCEEDEMLEEGVEEECEEEYPGEEQTAQEREDKGWRIVFPLHHIMVE